jgi:hypothetical protein
MTGLDPTTMISLLGATLIGSAALLAVLPVGTCSQCSHCRLERLARQQQRETEASRAYGEPDCAVCGRHHRPGEEHRP